jgi:hypothetical protein
MRRGTRIGYYWWGKPDGKRLLGGARCRWEAIKIDLGEVGWGV